MLEFLCWYFNDVLKQMPVCKALVMMHYLLWSCAFLWLSCSMLVLCSHLVCFEIMEVLVTETTLVFVFPLPHSPPLATPVVWVLYEEDSEEGKLNSFSSFSSFKYNGDYNVCMKQALYFGNNVLSQSKWVIFWLPSSRIWQSLRTFHMRKQ